MTEETWRDLETIFAESPSDAGRPGSEEEVEEVRTWLRRPLPTDYRDCLLRYGGAFVGQYPIYGVHQVRAMGAGKLRVREVNEDFRQKGWPHVDEWLIVSEDGYGNPIGIADDGRVLSWDHDLGGIHELGSSFEDFLRRELERLENG